MTSEIGARPLPTSDLTILGHSLLDDDPAVIQFHLLLNSLVKITCLVIRASTVSSAAFAAVGFGYSVLVAGGWCHLPPCSSSRSNQPVNQQLTAEVRRLEPQNKVGEVLESNLQHVMKSPEKITTLSLLQLASLPTVYSVNYRLQSTLQQISTLLTTTTDCFEPMRKWKNYCYQNQTQNNQLRNPTKIRKIQNYSESTCSATPSTSTNLIVQISGSVLSSEISSAINQNQICTSSTKEDICLIDEKSSSSSKHQCSETSYCLTAAAQSDYLV
jgi:hypothetical protein